MKTLEHTFHIIGQNNIIIVPVFFHIIMVQTIVSYAVGAMGIGPDPQLTLQSMGTLLPKFLSLTIILSALFLIIDSFFTSMTLSMVFEAWKKGRTKLDLSNGTKFFAKILAARLLYGLFALMVAAALFFPIALFSASAIIGILLTGAVVLIMAVFFFSFLWINEAIVAKGISANTSFPYSMRTSFKNPSLTLTTILFILTFYIVAQSVVNIFSFSGQVFLIALVGLLVSIFLKALVSILKIVSFLQAK